MALLRAYGDKAAVVKSVARSALVASEVMEKTAYRGRCYVRTGNLRRSIPHQRVTNTGSAVIGEGKHKRPATAGA